MNQSDSGVSVRKEALQLLSEAVQRHAGLLMTAAMRHSRLRIGDHTLRKVEDARTSSATARGGSINGAPFHSCSSLILPF
jgi:hypothetical protein